MIYQACLCKSSNLFEIEKMLIKCIQLSIKKNLSDVHKKSFSKVLLSILVSFKFGYNFVIKGVLFQQKTKKTWIAFMKNICVQWMCPTDSSHWDDDLYFKLADNFVCEHLFIQFVQSWSLKKLKSKALVEIIFDRIQC